MQRDGQVRNPADSRSNGPVRHRVADRQNRGEKWGFRSPSLLVLIESLVHSIWRLRVCSKRVQGIGALGLSTEPGGLLSTGSVGE